MPTTSHTPSAAPSSNAARSPRPSAVATRPRESRRDRHAHPVTQPLLQDDGLCEQGCGLLQVSTGQLLLTQPRDRKRLHVLFADLVRAGDALPMTIRRLHRVAGEAVAHACDEQSHELTGSRGLGPQESHRPVGLLRSHRRSALPDGEHRCRHEQQPQCARVVRGRRHPLIDQLPGAESVVCRTANLAATAMARARSCGVPVPRPARSPASAGLRRAGRKPTSTGRAVEP